MVQREPSLADLLADDMGNLRPGAVDLLIRDQPRRVCRRRRWAIRRLFIAFALILLIIVIKALSDEDDKGLYISTTNREATKKHKQSTGWPSYTKDIVPISEKKRIEGQNAKDELTGNKQEITDDFSFAHSLYNQTSQKQPKAPPAIQIGIGEDNIRGKDTNFLKKTNNSHHQSIKTLITRSSSSQTENGHKIGKHIKPKIKNMNRKEKKAVSAESKKLETYSKITSYLSTAMVFGFNINIRQSPHLDSPIVRQTNQGEVFIVQSFTRGWYKVVLEDDQLAFIFGAYLLPIDFKLSSHWVGLAKNRTKLLITANHHPDQFQVILPDGTKRYIRKKNVRIVK